MEKRMLGNTDIEVSKLCLGTMNWGYQNNEQEAHDQIDYALDNGINFMDTAEVYPIPPTAEAQGLTEKYIGTWFKKTGRRSEYILATKATGTKKMNKGIAHVRDGEGLTPSGIVHALEGSLARLQTDYVDLYQLHWPQRMVPAFGSLNFKESMIEEKKVIEDEIYQVLTTLQSLQQQGKIRHIGLSNETPWGVMKFLEIARENNLPRMQTTQNAYNLLRREYEIGLAEIAAYEGVKLLAYSPLTGGILSGKYQDGALPEGSRYALHGKDRMPQNYNARTLAATQKYIDIAEKNGISPVQLALAWVNDNAFVNSNIIGATSVDQLKECISSADIHLSDETMNEIDQVFVEYNNPATR